MSTKKSIVPVPSKAQELQQQIRQRAYELYEARDGQDGHDVEDWLRAEEEILQKEALSAAA